MREASHPASAQVVMPAVEAVSITVFVMASATGFDWAGAGANPCL
jgi:hypothetical protein